MEEYTELSHKYFGFGNPCNVWSSSENILLQKFYSSAKDIDLGNLPVPTIFMGKFIWELLSASIRITESTISQPKGFWVQDQWIGGSLLRRLREVLHPLCISTCPISLSLSLYCPKSEKKKKKNPCTGANEAKAGQLKEFPLIGGRVSLFVPLCRPSTNWTRPTHIWEGNMPLLSLMIHINLIQKHPYRYIQNNV